MNGEQPPVEGATTAVEPVEAAPTQIIRRSPKALSQRDPMQIAAAFVESGYFPDVKSKAQAVVKIIAGESLGLDAYAAITGLTIIEGKLGFTGNLAATLIKQHESYDYRVVETTNERCEIDFYADGEKVGTSEFTVEDAERAELVKPKSNWVKWPKAMCFNRALTQGMRAFIPDVTAGRPAYTDEEIEEVIDVQPQEETAPPEPDGLDPAMVEQLAKGIELADLDLDHLNVELGSLGIDGFDPVKDLGEQLATLTPEQAEALDAALQKKVEAEAGGEEADDAGD